MNKRNLLIFAVLAIAVTLVGFVFLRGPTPHISIKPETIATVGPVDITNTMLTSWLVVATMIITVLLTTRRWDLVPGGVQNTVEGIVEAFYNLVVGVAGEKNGRRFFPVVATIFFFVLASNWLSLLPVFNVIGEVHEEEHGFVLDKGSAGPFDVNYVPLSGPGALSGDAIEDDDPNHEELYEEAIAEGKVVGELFPYFRGPNTDLNTTLALAIVSAIFVEAWGISTLGLFTYGSKFIRLGGIGRGIVKLNPGMILEGMIDAFVGGLEFVSEIVRLLSFTARLFGNMFAGEVVILMFTFMTPLLITVVFYGLELFVGVIQAFIFAMLTLVFGVSAVTHHGNGHEEHKEHVEGASEGAVAHGVS
ncbi:MAG: F0F1 ATP synthase subunit A [Dehalococcoidia bacterium]